MSAGRRRGCAGTVDIPSSHRRHHRLVLLPSPQTPLVHQEILRLIAPPAWLGMVFSLVCLKYSWGRDTRQQTTRFDTPGAGLEKPSAQGFLGCAVIRRDGNTLVDRRDDRSLPGGQAVERTHRGQRS